MWDGWERGHRGRLTTEVAHGDADTYFRHARRVKKRVVALLASGDPYMKLWEMQNALLAAMQIGSPLALRFTLALLSAQEHENISYVFRVDASLTESFRKQRIDEL